MKNYYQQYSTLVLVCLLVVHGHNVWAKPDNSTADHSKFEELQVEFKSGPEVTKACLSCHTEAAKQIHKTTHWRWEYLNPDTKQKLGKSHILNNYCISPQSNYATCTACHIGYNWRNNNYDFDSQTNVDCLSCHDTTGGYKKIPGLAGHPNYKPMEWPKKSGKIIQPPNLKKIAQNVGKTSRATCGACHFKGGGGDAVKHGDLDTSLMNPSFSLDVHMDKKGLNFSCTECHVTDNHAMEGSRYKISAKDNKKAIIKGEKTNRVKSTCQACHSNKPHEITRLNNHSKKIACQTCHIPTYARGGIQTKMTWDWSTAGKMNKKGKPFMVKDSGGRIAYTSKKGTFTWDSYVIPDYQWFNGKVTYTLRDAKIDPSKLVMVNKFHGSDTDGKSKIWPVRNFFGKQPFDKNLKTLLIPHTAGKDDSAFWKNFDWDKAFKAGADISSPYSGEYGFVETQMSWPITHMVAPGHDSLTCEQCHRTNSRLKNIKGVYMPAAHNIEWLDNLAGFMLLLTLGGVGIHGMIRIVLHYRRNKT
jgi:octaheme c-type cytochrome (tetrathionate reductase family)